MTLFNNSLQKLQKFSNRLLQASTTHSGIPLGIATGSLLDLILNSNYLPRPPSHLQRPASYHRREKGEGRGVSKYKAPRA